MFKHLAPKRSKKILSFRPRKANLVNNSVEIIKYSFSLILRADFDGQINGYLDNKEGLSLNLA